MSAAVKRGIYRVAGHTFEIRSLHDAVHILCRDYAVPDPPELVIETAPADIEQEREKAEKPCSDAYLEQIAVCRKLARALLQYDVLLFHASAVAVDGAAYLFAAVSGTGKSTHAALWRALLGERAVMVNDDKPFLHITEDRVEVFGSPWCGKHRLQTNICVPVRAVCSLHRAQENTIAPLTPYAALPVLLQQALRPTEQDALLQTVRLVGLLSEHVQLWTLGCNMEPDAARLAYETMSKA